MSASATGLEVRGLSFGYPAQPVLHDLELTLCRGRTLALIGSSGTGKSTLLRLLAGFERPQAGTIALHGQTVVDTGARAWVPPARRGVGIVPQEGALFPHLTLEANIGYGLGRRDPGRGDRIDELVALVGLDDLRGRYPRELSGGQQQRVALARALAPRPELVLLDEPFASLDAATRRPLLDAVREILTAESATAVLVTHDRDEAVSLCDDVAVLRDGLVAQAGPPDQVYGAPHDAGIARALGEADLLPVVEDLGETVECALGRLIVGSRSGRGEVVVLRPHQIVVTPVGADRPAGTPNGTVTSSTFHGTHLRVTLALAEGTVLTAHLPTPVTPAPTPGDRVHVAVAAPVHLASVGP